MKVSVEMIKWSLRMIEIIKKSDIKTSFVFKVH